MYTPVSQRKNKIYKPVNERLPFEATKTGIALNTIKGLLGWTAPKDNPYLKVSKDIAQTTARSFGQTGLTLIGKKELVAKTKEGKKIQKIIYGEEPLKDIAGTVETTKEKLKPYIGEKGAKYTALPLVLGSIAMDLTLFGGGKKVPIKNLDIIPEAFFKKMAKETDVNIIEKILKKVGLDDLNSKSLAENFVTTKNIDEAKNVLSTYTPVKQRTPLGEIIKKETLSEYSVIHNGGVVEKVEGEQIKILDDVETFIHKDENGNWAVSEVTTGRNITVGGYENKNFAIKAARENLNALDSAEIKKLISENQLPKTKSIPKDMEPLEVEARKYKSAEELAKNTYFHATTSENATNIFKNGYKTSKGELTNKVSSEIGDGVFLYRGDNMIYGRDGLNNAQTFAKNFSDSKVIATKVDGKILNTQKAPSDLTKEMIDSAKSKGYVGIKGLENGTPYTFVFDAKSLKTIGDATDYKSLTDIWNKAQGASQETTPQKVLTEQGKTLMQEDKIIYPKQEEVKPSLLPAIIQGDTFSMGTSKTIQPTIKGLKTELKATQKEIKNAQIAKEKADKLELKEQKTREEAISNLNKFKGNTNNTIAQLKSKNLSDEDISNIVLEDGTKLTDTIKVKRNSDGSLSTTITKKELDNIVKNYTDEVPKQKWEKKSMLVSGAEIPMNLLKSVELPYAYFERKGLSPIYDQIIQAQRDGEIIKNRLLQKFKDADLYKEGGYFTANNFKLSENEAKGVSKYYLGRQGRAKEIPITDLSENAQKFVKVFDDIISETTTPFYEVAKRMGKNPGVVENYAPIMTRDDIKLIDQGGSQDWLFRKHPAFFSLKERVKKAPENIYETDYRKVASRWLEGITQFISTGDTTNHLKYLINSDEFRNSIKEQDYTIINKWLQDITTPKISNTLAGKSFNDLSKLLRKGTAMGSLGLNYATILKQALTQIPITIIEKSLPKFKSEYAKAFGIDVSKLPSISKRTGDIAISDLQGKIGRIFTGGISQFDKKNAQLAINGLLDKEYNKFLKGGAEITPEIRKVIEKNAQDKIDMWFGGFFKGQRPEAYREELGNFILMFTYPLTSQANGFFRHMLKAKGFIGNIKAVAEVLASVVGIAYMEQVIENLTPQWSDTKEMAKDVLISATGNIPLAGQIAYAIDTGSDMNISPVIGNINNIINYISEGKGEKIGWTIAETAGLPKQIRRIKEGFDILEEGGITDNNGKMMAPVQDTIEYIRAFLRGKYGPLASQDYIRNIGESKEDRRWFVPEVEFLQNGDYDRKAELYKTFDTETKKELYNFLSENQQKKLDKVLKGTTPKTQDKKALSDIFK